MSVPAVANSGSTAAGSPISQAAMGKEDFLALLVAQLKNQDPLNPSDPTEFTAQLAQFSSLEQFFTMNSNLERMVANQAEAERLSAVQMIGQEAVFAGESFQFDGEPVAIGYELTLPVAGVEILVRNQAGQPVAALRSEELSAGTHFISWDGKGSSGEIAAAGPYSLQISGTYDGENPFSLQPLIRSEVQGVDLNASGSVFATRNGSFGAKAIKGVGAI